MATVNSRWQRVWDALVRDGRLFESGYGSLILWQRQQACITQYTHGVVLDLGAGKLPFRPALEAAAEWYISLDVDCEHPELSLIGSGERLPFVSESIDTIFSSQVMEHVPHPWCFAEEMSRVLKPGGSLILSVPFIYYIHGEPHDYFRFTPYAVRNLLEENELEIVLLETVGGLFAFGAQFIQSPLLGLTYLVPVVKEIGWGVNRLINVVAGWFDRMLGQTARFPQNVLVVARKPSKLAE